MADSSIYTANSARPHCYQSDSSTDQCSSNALVGQDPHSDGLNNCCGNLVIPPRFGALNIYYSLNGGVDCKACELFKYLKTNYSYILAS